MGRPAHGVLFYAEGTPASAPYSPNALTASGFQVTVRPPTGLPSTKAQLDPFDVVVLSDVARAAISAASMSALATWVEQGGGGLLVAGGEAIFGEGGYRKTPIERLAPVTFERRDEPEVALILVLDRSWSMAGSSMDLCKAAAQAALDVMTDEQTLGVLTFNDQFDWDVTLRNVGKNRDGIRERSPRSSRAGHTLIFPALEQAYLALRTAKSTGEARRAAVRRSIVPGRLRGAGDEDGQRADDGVHRGGRPVSRPGTAAQHREVGQGTLVSGRRREGAAPDLRQGSEERGHARVR